MSDTLTLQTTKKPGICRFPVDTDFNSKGVIPVLDYPDMITPDIPVPPGAKAYMKIFHEHLIIFAEKHDIDIDLDWIAGKGSSIDIGLDNFVAETGGWRIWALDYTKDLLTKKKGYRKQIFTFIKRLLVHGPKNEFTLRNMSLAIASAPGITDDLRFDLSKTAATEVTLHPAVGGKVYKKHEHNIQYYIQYWHKTVKTGKVPKHKVPLGAKVFTHKSGAKTVKVSLSKKIALMGGDPYEAMELVKTGKKSAENLEELRDASIAEASKKCKKLTGLTLDEKVAELAKLYPDLGEGKIREILLRDLDKYGDLTKEEFEKKLLISMNRSTGRLTTYWLWDINTIEVLEMVGAYRVAKFSNMTSPEHVSIYKASSTTDNPTLIKETYIVTKKGEFPKALLSKIDSKIMRVELFKTLKPLLQNILSPRDLAVVEDLILNSQDLERTAKKFNLKISVISKIWEMMLVNLGMQINFDETNQRAQDIPVDPIQGDQSKRHEDLKNRYSKGKSGSSKTAGKSGTSDSTDQPDQGKSVPFDEIARARRGDSDTSDS